MKTVICTSYDVLPLIRSIKDSFSEELINLWDFRKLSGTVFYAFDESLKDCLGYILVEEQKDHVTIRGFYVKEECRGNGHGTTLLKAVDDHYCFLGKDIYVNITKGAENLYVKEGHELLGPREDFPDQIKAIRKHAKQSIIRPVD